MGKCTGHLDNKEKGFYVCSVCECPVGTHCYWFHCPLLQKEMICMDCCHNEIEKKETIDKLKSAGLEYTREQIDAICKDCGNRTVEESNGNNVEGT